MSGVSNFPTALDDDSSLYDVVDNTTPIIAAHHNNIKEAVKRVEAKVGIYGTSSPTSLDYRLGHPSFGHAHDGASGQGRPFPASAILMPATGLPTGGAGIIDHVVATEIHGPIRATGIATAINQMLVHVPSGPRLIATGAATVFGQTGATVVMGVLNRHSVQIEMIGSAVVGSISTRPYVLGRTMQLESVQGAFRVGPSGATTAFILRFGASQVYGASPGNGVRFAPGASVYRQAAVATPNVITYPSGAVITLDTEAVGSNEPGQDLGLNLTFRE